MNIIETNVKFKNSLAARKTTKRIFVHHADAKTCDVATIDKWHKNNGWSGIGYHFLVRKDGNVYRGRPIDTVGAHCLNNNSDSIGICFEGDYDTEKSMPEAQKNAGVELIRFLCEKYKLTNRAVLGHRDAMATACPGRYFPLDYFKKYDYNSDTKTETTTTKTTTSKPTVAKPTIKLGSTGTQVKYLQKDLNYLGFKGANGNKLTVDGDCGNNTVYALKSFQKKHKLTVDGIYGSNSQKAMKSAIK